MSARFATFQEKIYNTSYLFALHHKFSEMISGFFGTTSERLYYFIFERCNCGR